MSKVLEILKNEPAVVTSVVVSALVAVCGHFGIVLDHASVTEVVSILVVGVLTRQFVTPNRKVLVDKS